MSYSRWGCGNKIEGSWYIFWVTRDTEERLAAWEVEWHDSADSNDDDEYSIAEIKYVLDTGDFSRIRGFKEEYREFLIGIFKKWVDEVTNKKYIAAQKGL